MTTFNITAGKRVIEICLEINQYDFKLMYNNGSIICNGYYNYNKTEVIFESVLREFFFFEDELKSRVERIALKNKFIKKQK